MHPAWFDRHDLADYAAACLRAGLRSGPGTAATAPTLARAGQVATAIAEAAGSNFLVAGLAARTRADEPVIDVSAPGWRDRQRFPAEVGQAFEDYLARFGDNETRARISLRALAYAEGAGLARRRTMGRHGHRARGATPLRHRRSGLAAGQRRQATSSSPAASTTRRYTGSSTRR